MVPDCCMQYFGGEHLTTSQKTNVVAVTNDFYIFKFWQESHGRKDSSFFIFESNRNNLVNIGDQPTHKKMQATGYKSARAALQALCA